MFQEKTTSTLGQESHLPRGLNASSSTATIPRPQNPVDIDEQDKTKSQWGECAEQRREARLSQLEGTRLHEDFYKDEQTITTADRTLGPKRSGANRDPLGPSRQGSPGSQVALKASLFRHTSLPVLEALRDRSQRFPTHLGREIFRDPGLDHSHLKPRDSRDHRIRRKSSSLVDQTSSNQKDRTNRDTDAKRQHMWNEVNDKYRVISELKETAKTCRSILTQAERQSLRTQQRGRNNRDLAAGSDSKRDISPSKQPRHSELNSAVQQPNQQGNYKSTGIPGILPWLLPNAPLLSNDPHSQQAIYHLPSQPQPTPPPPPTPSIPAAVPQISYHHQHPLHSNPPANYPPTPITYTSSANAAPRCSGCNVDLAEIERTTPFRYPDACPLCQTPRMYLPFPPQLQAAESPILQPWRSLQHREMALAGTANNPAPDVVQEENLHAVFVQNRPTYLQAEDRHPGNFTQNSQYGPDGLGIRMIAENEAPEHEEQEGFREDELYNIEDMIPRNRAEPEAGDDGNDDYDEDAIVDEEEWEQERGRREWEKWCYDEEE